MREGDFSMLASSVKALAFSSIFSRLRTLKFSLLFATGCMAALMVAEFAHDGFEAWTNFQFAKTLRTADRAGNRLVSAIYFLLREQPVINTAFKAPEANAAYVLQRARDHQKVADQDLTASLSSLRTLDFPNRQALADDVQSARRAVDAARIGAFAMIDVSPSEREPAVLADYNSAMARLINTAQELWTAASYLEAQNDPVLARYSRIKSISWRLREIAGVERTAVTTAIITHGQISPADARAIENGRAQIQLGWQLIAELAKAEISSAPVKLAMTQTEWSYFDTFQPLVDQMLELSGRKAPYPMALTDWVEKTNPYIDSFLVVLNAAATAGEQRAGQLEADAFFDLTIKIAGVIIALGATAVCFLLIVWRVTDPLARLSATVRELASGNLDVRIADTDQGDEIGDVARAVDFFKANLVQTKHMTAIQDAEHAAKEKRAAALEAMAKAFEAKVTGVAESFESSSTELEASSRSLSVSAEETNRQSHKLATAAWQASENVQIVAVATGQLARSAQDIGDRVAISSRITRNAVEYSRQADTTIEALTKAADQIGEVVRLISNVAQQTNLLALNAKIGRAHV